MYSYLNMDTIKKIFINKIYKIEVINLTKAKNLIGHRNLIFIKIKKI